MTRLQYLLVVLAEECAEVAQRSSKAIRFGANQTQVTQDLTNIERIDLELQDLYAVVGMIRKESQHEWFGEPKDYLMERKLEKVERYMAETNFDALDREFKK